MATNQIVLVYKVTATNVTPAKLSGGDVAGGTPLYTLSDAGPLPLSDPRAHGCKRHECRSA